MDQFFGGVWTTMMIAFDEAIDLIRLLSRPLGRETVRMADSIGRVLAIEVTAEIDAPRSDVAAMDGFAVRDEDISKLPVRLKIAGQSFAGSGWDGRLERGTCVRIFTGARIPNGADRVIVQEQVTREGDLAIIRENPGGARHIRRRGSDFADGDVLLRIGKLLDARALVAAAGADVGCVEVFRQPRVAVLSTGDELADPGRAKERADAIPESVSLGVGALAEYWGAVCMMRKRLPDDLALMRRESEAALEAADVVIVTGGASVGERDFAKAIFEPHGMELVFSKLSVKPGKPVWLGRAAGRSIVGLPGNPTSAMVTARLLLAPLLCGLSGRDMDCALRWRSMPIATALGPCGSRETFHRAVLTPTGAEVLSFQDSSAQKALADADLLVRQRANSPGIDEGALAEVIGF